MATTNQAIGIVTEVPMGDWNATTQYYKLNTVRYNGATYIAKKQNQGFEPTVSTGWEEVWQLVVQDGAIALSTRENGVSMDEILSDDNAAFSLLLFNRTPVQNDSFLAVVLQMSDNREYFCIMRVDYFDTTKAYCAPVSKVAVPQGAQGASTFHTMSASGTSIAVSSLQPSSVTPLVGDAVQFPNGDVRQITAVSGSTVTLGNILFSLKGDAGIGNATLSNIDGDSTTEGFTQAAVKGIAQAKNYYNLGAFDTYVSNGNGTGTSTSKTRLKRFSAGEVQVAPYNYNNIIYYTIPKPTDYISYKAHSNTGFLTNKFPVVVTTGNWDNTSYIGYIAGAPQPEVFWIGFPLGTTLEQAQNEIDGLIMQYEVASQYQYTRQVIENQPIHTANQDEEWYWHEEWRKGLNLFNISPQTIQKNGVTVTINSDGTVQVVGSATSTSYIIIPLNEDIIGNSMFTFVNTLGVRIGFELTAGGTAISAQANSKSTAFVPTNIHSFWINIIADQTYNTSGKIMFTRGTVPYPHKSYNGKIIHEIDLSGIQLFPQNVNPAQTIGGDWVDLGTTTIGTTTLHAYQKVSGGN